MSLKDQLIKENFNQEQIEVILDHHKETIVPAGAGSGKTKTLVKKVISLLEDNVPLEKLLVLTFTNKASFEMKERIKKSLSHNPSLAHLTNKIDTSSIQTFDAFALNYVKQNASYIEKESNLEILDSTVLKTAKYEKMSRLIYRYYLDDKYLDFFKVFTDKTIFKELTAMLIKLYDDISSKIQIEKLLNENLDNYLIKDAFLLLDQAEKISDVFYENNQDMLQELKAFLQSLFDGRWHPDQSANIRFKWNDANHVKSKIEGLIKPIVDLYKKGIEQRHLDEYKKLYHQYQEVIKNIMIEFHEEIESFKIQTNKYDFSDISKFLIDILSKNSELLNRMRSQYHYIFVDEFQDTSDVQYQFLDMMIKDNDHVQVLYVGDIKQSIYKFRDAKPELFIKKHETAHQIRLKTNYRSSKPIIDIVNHVFTHIMNDEDKLDINYQHGHVMASGSTAYQQDTYANVYIEEMFNEDPSKSKYNVLEEAFTIGKKINQLVSEAPDVAYKDITILLRNTTSFDQYKEVFEYLNIPLQIQTDVKINQGYFLKLLTNVLMLALYYKNSEEEFVKKNRFNYLSLGRSELLNLDDGLLFHQLKNKHENPKMDQEILEKLEKLHAVIEEGTNFQIIQRLLDIFDVESKIIHSYEQYKKEIEMDYLFKLAESLKDLGYHGESFVNYLHEMMYQKDEQIKISILQDHEENSVKITNIHQSKGLEYEVLFLGGLDKPIRKSINRAPISYDTDAELIIKKLTQEEHKPLELLLELNKTVAKEAIYQNSIKEELRLLYVAMTRAERALYLVLLNKENRDSMRTFGDYLVDADIYDLIDNSRITKYDESQFESNYYQGLTMKNMYYPNKINDLKSKTYHFEQDILNEQIASTRTRSLLSNIDKENLRTGTKLHEKFEYADFKKLRYSDDPMLRALGEVKFSDKFIEYAKSVVHEYQFFDNERKLKGIIDLLVIYDKEVHIIDYKSRDIDKNKYERQLQVYQKHIEDIYPNHQVITFLYSLALKKTILVN